MKRLQSWLRKLLALSWLDRWLLVEAFFGLALIGFAIRILPFRRVARLLRLRMGDAMTAETPDLAVRVGWAVTTAAQRTPWRSTCLAQAVVGKMMLLRRKIPATLSLGVAKSPADALQAHAWLRCGEQILTGRAEYLRFNVIANFV
ncbi:MAG: lasso peptide biosynthesis B2 protein [Chloroflexota bacterium]